jgi:HK97 family phage major capsid protein
MTTATEHAAEAKKLGGILETKTAELDQFTDLGVKVEEGPNGEFKGLVINPEDAEKARKLLGECTELKQAIVDHETAAGLREFLNGSPGTLGNVAVQSGPGWDGTEYKTVGDKVTDSETWAEWKESGFKDGKSRSIQLEGTSLFIERKRMSMLGIEVKDIYTARGGQFTAPAFGHTDNHGIVQPARRSQRVRDLLQVGTTTANLIEFIRVTGFTNGAAPVSQRADGSGNWVDDFTGSGTQFMLKPESDLEFTPDSTPVRLLAHTIRAHRTVLDDEPRLQGIIDTEMLYGLQLSEDAQLLTGDGTDGGLIGLLNTEGIQVYNQRTNGGSPGVGAVTERKSEAIRRSLTLVLLAYYESTGVVVSPLDWEDIELEKDKDGRPILVTNIAMGAQKQVWRMPVTETPALAQGHFVTGAFGIGARVWDRMQASVDISTEDRDNFVRNAVTIRAEERLALEVQRPEAFVHGRFYGDIDYTAV